MGINETIVAGLAIFLGMMIVLIPITGLTARFALKPLMEAFRSYRQLQGENQAQELLERRVALMEEQLHSLERSMRELVEESEFRRDLESGRQAAAALPLPGSTAPAQPQVTAQVTAQAEPVRR